MGDRIDSSEKIRSWKEARPGLFLAALLRSRPLAALAAGLTAALGLAEGMGLLLLVPLLDLLGLGSGQGALGGIAGAARSALQGIGLEVTLPLVLLSYAAIVSAGALIRRWQTLSTASLQQNLVADLRERLYRAIAGMRWVAFSRNRSSDFMHGLTSEVERAGAAVHHLLQTLVALVLASVYLAFALRVSPVMTGVVSACGLGLAFALKGRIRRVREAGTELSEATGGLYGAISEHLGGMKTVKSYDVGERHIRIFTELVSRARALCLGTVRSQADLRCLFEIGSVLVLSIVVYAAVRAIALPSLEIIFLIFLFARILPRISSLEQSWGNFLNYLPSFSSVLEMEGRLMAAAEPTASGREPVSLREALRFEGVSFAYDGRPILRDLDLTIPAGMTTAIVGPSGAGKSTIADLAIGIVGPEEGRILIDGIPLSPERMSSWREMIGYVGQDPFLFHDTVRGNLLWARPGARDADLREALELAAAWEFVRRLPKGLETVPGDRGVCLSCGERQRLALARALLRKPSLLILDEATSNLDAESERRIQRAVEGLHGRLTILVISHRLSSVQGADAIHLLEDGRLVESEGKGEDAFQKRGRMGRFLSGLSPAIPSPLLRSLTS